MLLSKLEMVTSLNEWRNNIAQEAQKQLNSNKNLNAYQKLILNLKTSREQDNHPEPS